LSSEALVTGDVIIGLFPEQIPLGREQQGTGNLYPKLAAGIANLPQNSIALLDQVRSLDSNRLVRYLGTLVTEQYQPIQNGLVRMLNQNQASGDSSDRGTQEESK
jgi:mRNA interferase MazF